MFRDGVFETSETTGTGPLTLAGPVTGARSFRTAFGDGPVTVGYVIRSAPENGQFETGVGSFEHTGGSDVLTRTTVLASSNSGAAVDWPPGTRNVWCGPLAEVLNFLVDGGIAGERPAWLPEGGFWTDNTDPEELIAYRYIDGKDVELGRFLVSTAGVEWVPAGRPAGTLLAFTCYQTPGTDTHNYASGARLALVRVKGGGGGSGGIGSAGAAASGGGGEGGEAWKLIDVSARGGADTYTVGAGGSAGSSGANNGGTGGTTSWASDVSATGGAGSDGVSSGGSGGGAGGSGLGGDINLTGQGGGGGSSSGGRGAGGGQGGGAATRKVGDGVAGANGGGAAGATTADSTNRAGAAGGDGFIMIWEFA